MKASDAQPCNPPDLRNKSAQAGDFERWAEFAAAYF
jgi:hypothetical protein